MTFLVPLTFLAWVCIDIWIERMIKAYDRRTAVLGNAALATADQREVTATDREVGPGRPSIPNRVMKP